MNLLLHCTQMLAAAKLSPTVLIGLGAAVTLVVSMITYSYWRLGVKTALVMAIFEGALRKWALPGAQELAYFVKDIFLIGAYAGFYMSPDAAVRSWAIRRTAG